MTNTSRARPGTLHLTLGGMHAVHSARLAFTALGGVPGVTNASVEIGRAELDHDGTTPADELVRAITTALADVGIEVVQVHASARSLPMA